jgi:hypothetical protein
MKTLFTKHHLIHILCGVGMLLILPVAHAQYNWGTWTQDTGTTLHNDNSGYGTAYLSLVASTTPSTSVTAGQFQNLWGPNPIAAAGIYSLMSTGPVMTNGLAVTIDLRNYNTDSGTALFGFSDIAAIGYNSAALSYQLKAYDANHDEIAFYSWAEVGHDINTYLPTDNAALTINSSTGVLDFDNPQAGHDSQGYFYSLEPGTAYIELTALRTTGGDGLRVYLGAPAVPEPGTWVLVGLGVAVLAVARQKRQAS